MEIKFQVLLNSKIIGVERLSNYWEWSYYYTGERWTAGVFGNSSDLIRRQYIGLKDKNLKEIYDGDLFRFKNMDNLSKVVFHNGSFGYMTGVYKYPDFISFAGNAHNLEIKDGIIHTCEVVGNIYENSEQFNTK